MQTRLLKTIGGAIVVLALAAIGGCQAGWVRVDGGRADKATLEQARATCRVDEKLAALQRARDANYDEAARAGSNEGRMLQIDSFEEESYAVYQEIDACMRRQGLQKTR